MKVFTFYNQTEQTGHFNNLFVLITSKLRTMKTRVQKFTMKIFILRQSQKRGNIEQMVFEREEYRTNSATSMNIGQSSNCTIDYGRFGYNESNNVVSCKPDNMKTLSPDEAHLVKKDDGLHGLNRNEVISPDETVGLESKVSICDVIVGSWFEEVLSGCKTRVDHKRRSSGFCSVNCPADMTGSSFPDFNINYLNSSTTLVDSVTDVKGKTQISNVLPEQIVFNNNITVFTQMLHELETDNNSEEVSDEGESNNTIVLATTAKEDKEEEHKEEEEIEEEEDNLEEAKESNEELEYKDHPKSEPERSKESEYIDNTLQQQIINQVSIQCINYGFYWEQQDILEKTKKENQLMEFSRQKYKRRIKSYQDNNLYQRARNLGLNLNVFPDGDIKIEVGRY